MSKELIQKLQALKQGDINPSPEWLKNSREQLYLQIKNTVAPKQDRASVSWESIWQWLSIFIPRRVVYNFVRPLAVLVLVVLVGSSARVAGVDAAYDALPGDGVAYFLKRGIEKTQVAFVSLVGDDNAEAKVHLKLAASRASEVKKILVRDLPANQKRTHVATAVADLKEEMAAVSGKISARSDAKTVKEVALDTKQIKSVLQEAKNTLSATTSVGLAEAVKEAKDLANDVSVKAVEVLVNKQLAGDQTVPQAEVRQVVSSTLQSIASDVLGSKQTAEGVKAAVDTAVQNQIKISAISASSSVVSASSSSSVVDDLAARISAAVDQTSVVAKQTSQVDADVAKQVSEAQAALSSGDLFAAVGTIKDVAQVSKTVEQLTDAVVQQVQGVFPIAETVKNGSDITTSSSSLNTMLSGASGAANSSSTATTSQTSR